MLCTELGAHITPDSCKPSMNDVQRIYYKLYSGTATGFDGAASEAAYITGIQTEATWDTEIALTGVDKLVGSPTIQSHDFPETLPSIFQAEDTTGLGYDRPSREVTFKCYGITSANLEALKSSHQKPIKFCLYLKDGSVRVNKYVSAATDIFFDAELMAVSDITHASGSAADYVVIKLSLAYGAMDSFQDVPNCSFLLNK